MSDCASLVGISLVCVVEVLLCTSRLWVRPTGGPIGPGSAMRTLGGPEGAGLVSLTISPLAYEPVDDQSASLMTQLLTVFPLLADQLTSRGSI